MQSILEFGVRLIVGLQGLGAWPILPMQFFSFLGTEVFFLLALPILYWCVDSMLGLRVAVMLLIGTNINAAFKLAFHGPRPYWYSPKVSALATETSFGVPSGHAQTAATIWGLLAAYLRKWWGWLVVVLLIFLIGLSRLYLGVHFPQDVLLGWLIGGLVLWLALRCWDPIFAWTKKLHAGQQVLAAFLASLLLFLLPVLPFLWLKVTNWQPPQDWAMFASQTLSLSDVATVAGLFFGMLVGVVWLAGQGGFQTKGLWWKLVLRYLLGVVGVFIIRYGLKFIFPSGENALAYFFGYLRYMVIGFWVTGGAPWTFIRVKLAEKLHNASITVV
ncbi:MAG: phosphatase PAP2 family protein [Anaerolineales bacterium]|jgi:membrane-associated phospholipid phosphatase